MEPKIHQQTLEQQLATGEVLSVEQVMDRVTIDPQEIYSCTVRLHFSRTLHDNKSYSDVMTEYSEDQGIDLNDEEMSGFNDAMHAHISRGPYIRRSLDSEARQKLRFMARGVKARIVLFEQRAVLGEALAHVQTPEQFIELFPESIKIAAEERVDAAVSDAVQPEGARARSHFAASAIDGLLRVSENANPEQRHEIAEVFTQGIQGVSDRYNGVSIRDDALKHLIYRTEIDTEAKIDIVSELAAVGMLSLERLMRLITIEDNNDSIKLISACLDKVRERGDEKAFARGVKKSAYTDLAFRTFQQGISEIAPKQLVDALDKDGTHRARTGGDYVVWSMGSIFKIANMLGKQINARREDGEPELGELEPNFMNLSLAMSYITRAIEISDPSVDTAKAHEAIWSVNKITELVVFVDSARKQKVGKAPTAAAVHSPDPRVQELRQIKGRRDGPSAPRTPGKGLIS